MKCCASGFKQATSANPTLEIDCVPSDFAATVRNHLSAIDGNVTLKPDYTPKPLRKHDQVLMEMAVQSRKFTAKQLARINAIRMHLRTVFLGEICNAQGTEMRNKLAKGNDNDNEIHVPTTNVLNQPEPGRTCKRQRQRLTALFTSTQNKLTHPLGPHTANHSQRGLWSHHSNVTGTQTHQHLHEENCWIVCNKLGTRLLCRHCQPTNPANKACFPIDV